MEEQDLSELVDIPEHTRKAVLRAAFRRHQKRVAQQVLDATQTSPTGAVTPALANDRDRRALFLAEVGRRVMAQGSSKTAEYLQRVYRFKRHEAWDVIKEARRELAAAMATQTDELRAVAEARLEFMMRKALAAADLTNYGRAVKEWMRLHGLYRQDDTTLSDFAALMRKVTAETKANKVIDADFTVGEEEEKPSDWGTPGGFEPGPDEDGDDEPEDA